MERGLNEATLIICICSDETNSTPLNSEKEFLYMKATGIVRRIEEYGIIGQKSKNPHKHYGF